MQRRIVLLFPGQGSQYVGMGRSLCDEFPLARQAFEEASDALHDDVARLCFEGPADRLALTANTQPAILTVSVATWRVLKSETDLTPFGAAGHSLGEYSALVAAGVLAFENAVALVRKRGEFMQEAVPEGKGAMAAIMGLSDTEVEGLCEEHKGAEIVAPANYNAPGQLVISGHKEAVERVSKAAQDKEGCRVIPLNVSAPFHSPLMIPAGERLHAVLQEVRMRNLDFNVLSNVTAAPYPSKEAVADLLTRQVSHPVLWRGCMESLFKDEVDLALELGPKRVLLGLMKRISPAVRTAQMEDREGLKAALEVLT